MLNPYNTKTLEQFWRAAVADRPVADVRPIPAKRFTIPPAARIATAGSCFAQEVARVLVSLQDVEFFQTEPNTPDQPMFSALYGNVYTVRQFRQLFAEATGIAPQTDISWQRPDGRWVDALRPAMFADGFGSPADVRHERRKHLSSVRTIFSACSIFVFTLGLTEGWVSEDGGTVVPVAPGVVADDPAGRAYRFHNFTYAEVMDDLAWFLEQFRLVNPDARCILTVSPVPLVATYTDEHVLVATMHSKAILRTVCGEAEAHWENVFYFPSFEIISGHYNGGSYYNANKRTIAKRGIDHVMSVFRETYFGHMPAAGLPPAEATGSILDEAFQAGGKVICDEELVVKSVGF